MTQPRNPPTRAAFLSPARHNFGVPDFDVICFLMSRHFCDLLHYGCLRVPQAWSAEPGIEGDR